MEKWTICNKIGDFDAISAEFNISNIMARLLVNRGLVDGCEIKSYLSPEIGDLHSPHLLNNIDDAVALIGSKIRSGCSIRVVGDYDVDGIMSTYILNDALKLAGAKSDWYIPHRIRDGYGLNEDIIRKAYEDGVDTVITCDNGIAAVGASLTAQELGMTLVITDHHEIPDELPVAAYIVDPKMADDNYPCREICGAVVAAKFAAVLFEQCGIDANITRYLEFMAMATICDVVALQGENRVIAKLGMEALKNTGNRGLAALIREAGIQTDTLSEYHVGYILGPCFNATGRIDDAGLAYNLLSAETETEATEIALICKNLNEERKVMTAEQEKIAFTRLDALGEDLPKVIVLDMPDCHESILGILAGRIKERYNRPTIVVTKSGENYKGSARSIPAYNMFEELCSCREFLVKFGGHPMAAGLTVYDGMVEDFSRVLNEKCRLTTDDMCRKVLIDAEVSFNLFNEETVEEINRLAPFGQANSSPLFAERNLKCKYMRYMGKDNNFLRFKLINSYGHEFSATCFLDAGLLVEEMKKHFGEKAVDRAFAGGENSISFTAAYVPRINEFRDSKEIQMNIRAIKL